ncbi:MAG TPA: hypothetical protein VGE47_09805 [Burkholderiaceae bacterium]
MRTPSISSVSYVPEIPPDDPKRLQVYLRDEFFKIRTAIEALSRGHLDPTHVAPSKPRDGDWHYADGTNWNPGSGRGFYRFDGPTLAWVFLG